MSWSDERVELLKKLWGEGQSASQIAKELGGVTRNAVIGKVHRLGLSNRNGSGATGAESATKAKPAAKPEAKAKPAKPAAKPAPKPAPEAKEPASPVQAAPVSRAKQIIPAGQPLPPQPSRSTRPHWPRSARSKRKPSG